eukprot:Pgem_evm1s10238
MMKSLTKTKNNEVVPLKYNKKNNKHKKKLKNIPDHAVVHIDDVTSDSSSNSALRVIKFKSRDELVRVLCNAIKHHKDTESLLEKRGNIMKIESMKMDIKHKFLSEEDINNNIHELVEILKFVISKPVIKKETMKKLTKNINNDKKLQQEFGKIKLNKRDIIISLITLIVTLAEAQSKSINEIACHFVPLLFSEGSVETQSKLFSKVIQLELPDIDAMIKGRQEKKSKIIINNKPNLISEDATEKLPDVKIIEKEQAVVEQEQAVVKKEVDTTTDFLSVSAVKFLVEEDDDVDNEIQLPKPIPESVEYNPNAETKKVYSASSASVSRVNSVLGTNSVSRTNSVPSNDATLRKTSSVKYLKRSSTPTSPTKSKNSENNRSVSPKSERKSSPKTESKSGVRYVKRTKTPDTQNLSVSEVRSDSDEPDLKVLRSPSLKKCSSDIMSKNAVNGTAPQLRKCQSSGSIDKVKNIDRVIESFSKKIVHDVIKYNNGAVIIDNGSGILKAGFVSDRTPRVSFPTVVGMPRYQSALSSDDKEHYVGFESQSKGHYLSLKQPIERGLITDWDVMEKIWRHTFYNELAIQPEEHPVLLTVSPLTPKANKERMTQVMFEVFHVPFLFIVETQVLSLYANSGSLTGIVLDSGEGVTTAVPIYEGHVLPHAVTTLDLAGKDLSNYMLNLLAAKGYTFADENIGQSVKESLGYIAVDYENYNRSSGMERSHKLADGKVISLDKECFKCPEALFQPSLLGKLTPGIHKMIHSSIENCDFSIKRQMYSNIVLTGGSTLFNGLSARLKKELAVLAPAVEHYINIVAHPERKNISWTGGSVLASLTHFQKLWISRYNYEVSGPGI